MIGMQTRKPFTNSEMIDLLDVWLGLSTLIFGSVRLVTGTEELPELNKIALIISQRVGADVSLIPEMIQERSAVLFQHFPRGGGNLAIFYD